MELAVAVPRPVVSRSSDSILTSRVPPPFPPLIAAAAAPPQLLPRQKEVAGGHYGKLHVVAGVVRTS